MIAESVLIRWYYKGLVLARKGWVLSRYEVISGYIRPSGLLQRHFNTQSGPGCQDIIISWLIFLYYSAWLFLIVTFNHFNIHKTQKNTTEPRGLLRRLFFKWLCLLCSHIWPWCNNQQYCCNWISCNFNTQLLIFSIIQQCTFFYLFRGEW